MSATGQQRRFWLHRAMSAITLITTKCASRADSGNVPKAIALMLRLSDVSYENLSRLLFSATVRKNVSLRALELHDTAVRAQLIQGFAVAV